MSREYYPVTERARKRRGLGGEGEEKAGGEAKGEDDWGSPRSSLRGIMSTRSAPQRGGGSRGMSSESSSPRPGQEGGKRLERGEEGASQVGVAFAVASEAGRVGGDPKPNQDRCFVKLGLLGNGSVHLFGVCDGHGPEGERVASFVADAFPRVFGDLLGRSAVWRANVAGMGRKPEPAWERDVFPPLADVAREACRRTEALLARTRSINTEVSGTTLVALLLFRGQAVVVHVGDSLACVFSDTSSGAPPGLPGGATAPAADSSASTLESLASSSSGAASSTRRSLAAVSASTASTSSLGPPAPGAPGGALAGFALTTPHKPGAPSERRRIQAAGGRVHRRKDGASGQPVGPHRVWSREMGWQGPGLAMSRSLGDDVASRAGVICDPLVVSQALRAEADAWVVLASDGLGDALTRAEIAAVLAGERDTTRAAVRLVSAAHAQWLRAGLGSADTPGAYADDVSVVLLRLRPASASAEEGDAPHVGEVGEL